MNKSISAKTAHPKKSNCIRSLNANENQKSVEIKRGIKRRYEALKTVPIKNNKKRKLSDKNVKIIQKEENKINDGWVNEDIYRIKKIKQHSHDAWRGALSKEKYENKKKNDPWTKVALRENDAIYKKIYSIKNFSDMEESESKVMIWCFNLIIKSLDSKYTKVCSDAVSYMTDQFMIEDPEYATNPIPKYWLNQFAMALARHINKKGTLLDYEGKKKILNAFIHIKNSNYKFKKIANETIKDFFKGQENRENGLRLYYKKQKIMILKAREKANPRVCD